MKCYKKIIQFTLIVFCFVSQSFAQKTNEVYNIQNYITVNKDTLTNISISYRTLGRINADSSNIIVLFPYYGGTSEEVMRLVDSTRLLYPANYFFICIDPLGNGISSSPSNYKTQNGKEFPLIQIKDMTDIAYKLLTEKYKFSSVYGLVGGSMGGMQVFQFAADHPKYYSKGIAYCSTPAVTSSDIVANKVMQGVLQLSKSDTTTSETEELLNYLVSTSSQRIDKKINISKIDEILKTQITKSRASFTVKNKLLHLKAIQNHSIFTYYSKEEIRERFSNKLLVMVNKQDRLIDPAGSLDLFTFTKVMSLIFDSECGHLLASCEITAMREAINSFFVKKN